MSLSYTYEYKWTLIRMNKKSNNYFQKQDIVWFWWFTWVDDFSQLYHREVGVQNVMISCCRARGPHILVISVWKRFGADHDSFHSGLNWKTTGMKDTFFPLWGGGGHMEKYTRVYQQGLCLHLCWKCIITSWSSDLLLTHVGSWKIARSREPRMIRVSKIIFI